MDADGVAVLEEDDRDWDGDDDGGSDWERELDAEAW